MNLQTHISSNLWDAIRGPYESGNYSHAILEAVHHLTTILRDRSGADGDGAALVGQALGGDTPKLRVNAFQSESEKNVQRGIEQLLRGVYLAIRNPRSHEQFKDSQEDADAIVHFLDYILRILNASKEAFTVESFIASISDPEFVESKRYAELLVAEVPTNRRGDALAALFGVRRSLEVRKLRYLVPTLLSDLSDVQLARYLSTVSEEFRTTAEDVAIRTALQMLTPELWPRIAEASRLRIENKLIRVVEEGEIQLTGKTIGPLGTWASRFMKNFTLRADGARVLIQKLEGVDDDDRRYVAKYFMLHLPEILTDEREVKRAIRAISAAVQNGDVSIREAIIANVRQFPTNWQSQLAEALKQSTDPANPAVVLDDGTPLLEAPTSTEITDEDIPF
ncbi:MAG: TIGR02391 family protein [Acidobacteriia bacterium]|nr:TIGR02391 family protein [Terriglobia bacterium]